MVPFFGRTATYSTTETVTTGLTLLDDCRKLLRKILDEGRREGFERLIEGYATALKLARGPDKSRSLHWGMKAEEARERLENHYRLLMDD
jgi:hypothetical protein